MNVVVTGATGTIGRPLVQALRGSGVDRITVLTRDPVAARGVVAADRFVAWDGTSSIAPEHLDRVDVVYHLAGEPVAGGRWTEAKKRRILDSRRLGTRAVVTSLEAAGARGTLVSASAIGFYGSRGDQLLSEGSAPGAGFLPEVCQSWEEEAESAQRFGMRVAMMRIGIVLAPDGGALEEMVPLFRTGLAGRLGRGDQWMSWIHVDDVVGLLLRAGESEDLSGPVNVVGPRPVTNAELTQDLAHALHRPAILPAPAFALRLVFGELADVLLASQRVLPSKAMRAGYTFQHSSLPEALEDLVGARRSVTREVTA